MQWDTTKTDGQLRKTADNSRLKALLPGFEFTPFETGKTFFPDCYCRQTGSNPFHT